MGITAQAYSKAAKFSNIIADADLDIGAHAILTTNMSLYEGGANNMYIKNRAKALWKSLNVHNISADNALYSNILNRISGGAGVTVEGVELNTNIMKIDDINEKTGAHGVEIDGLVLKDSGLKTALATVQVVNSLGTTSWVDVDCTAHVGSGKCILMLKVVAVVEAGTIHVRGVDEEEGYNEALAQNGIYRKQLYSPNGHFDYKVSSGTDRCSIYLEGYIPVV